MRRTFADASLNHHEEQWHQGRPCRCSMGWTRPWASKDNATVTWQILGIKRTIQINDEDTHVVYWRVPHAPFRITIFTITGWISVSLDIKTPTEKLELGTQASRKSTRNMIPKEHNPLHKHPKPITTTKGHLGFLLSCPVTAGLSNHTQPPAITLPWNEQASPTLSNETQDFPPLYLSLFLLQQGWPRASCYLNWLVMIKEYLILLGAEKGKSKPPEDKKPKNNNRVPELNEQYQQGL